MKNLALGGAMLDAGMGIGCSRDNPEACRNDKNIQSSSVTSDDAASFSQK